MMPHVSIPVRVSPEVDAALRDGAPVVALESTLLAHGLPAPRNREVADELEAAVRAHGAVPATVAVLDGAARVGLGPADLDRVCAPGLAKLSVRDLGVAVGLRRDGATTVAATAALAALAGITLFATGGLGGVHRGARESWDVSADLLALARTPVLVVCSGVKSILDVAATLEVLETSSVPVLGYGTDAFPGFYLADSGFPVPWRVESPEEVAAIMAARARVGHDGAIVVANPLGAAVQLDPELHDRVLSAGLEAAAAGGVRGKDTTPFLLDFFHRETAGASLAANVALVVANAGLAAQVAAAYAG
jgi:pseudouridylate synthase